MSNKKMNKKERRGGARKGAGRQKGTGEMKKISVSVTGKIWDAALSIWRRTRRQRKPSWLVDGLVSRYVNSSGSILETEAV
jgi:hypothetical protein